MSRNQKKILLLDDDYESMKGLKDHLEEELSWDVELTAGKKIPDLLRQQHFDLIVVDLMIRPIGVDADNREVQNIHYDGVKWDRTGLEFIRRFRNGEYSGKGRGTPADTPLIALSAIAGSTASGEWGKILQKEKYVEKPFRLSDLVNLMQGLLQDRHND